MIATLGELFDGWALYLDKGTGLPLQLCNIDHHQIESPTALTPGDHTVYFNFKYDGGGIAPYRLMARRSRKVALNTRWRPFHYVGGDAEYWRGHRTPVNLSYDAPFTFTGTIDNVTIELKPQVKASAPGSKKAAEAGLKWQICVIRAVHSFRVG